LDGYLMTAHLNSVVFRSYHQITLVSFNFQVFGRSGNNARPLLTSVKAKPAAAREE